ncbi:MAG: hypothetical protein A2075_02685 [Geobacteraceae bacterium GWC2_58_44]|nr:MAG: hypothetical protein A2075_02685 [Geobacteraceae bacterium GWC2_58_44]
MWKKMPSRSLSLTLLLVILLGSSAWGASISGSVGNSTGKSGRIYLSLNSQNGGSASLGTSIAAAGAFTINGVQSGTPYTVQAFVDTQGTGIRHANDPSGSSGVVTAGSGNVPAGSFAVAIPSAVPAQAPLRVMVYPGNGANFVIWEGPGTDSGLPISDKYTVSWSASATGSPVAGSKDVWSGDKDFFAHVGASSALYYRVTAVAGGSSASSGWIKGAPPAGTGSVTGRVFFSGVTATGPLLVALANESASPPAIHVVAVANPVTGGSFSASNVPAGTYSIYPILDLNNSGTFDLGDIGPSDGNDFNHTVTVAGSPVTAPDVILDNVDASATLTTSHGINQWGEWYNLQLYAQSMKKQLVKVQIASGPQISGPIDLALDENQFRTWLNVSRPKVGDSYQINLTFSDGSTQTVARSVSAVLDGFATPLAPVGFIAFNPTPNFSWSAPSPAPAQYMYSLWLSEANGYGGIWDAWGMPSSQTSVPYGTQGDASQQSLTDGITYNWTINVTDSNGNQSQNQASFTPTSSPALIGFTPAGGLPGTSVTIAGFNFSTNPAQHTVLFNGVPAAVSAATSSTLTVTVPAGASTGEIQVNTGGKILISEEPFLVSAPLNIRGVIKSPANLPIAAARVEMSDDPTIFTSTGADGSYTLQPLFQGQNVILKVSKSGYVPTYSANFHLQENLDLTPYPSHLYTQADLAGWGVTPGKGVVVAQVLNTGTVPFSPVAGVQVTASGSANFGAPYPVTYYSGSSFGGSSTYGNGLFFVLNVSDYEWVNVSASKSSWIFNSTGFNVRADSVTEWGVFGNTAPPALWSFSPASGKAGTSVVISGVNFSSVAAENTVSFNGATATVTAAGSSSLTVTVPPAAATGPLSVTTAGGTANSGSNFIMRHTLSASVTGSGGGAGTVTSVPGGISCRASGSSGCTGEFDQGTQVQLVATEDAGSRLSAWSGACSGTAPCSFGMNADKSAGAAFELLKYLKNGGNYYSLLQDAFDAAAAGDTIQAQAVVFSDGALLFSRPFSLVRLKGGYDGSFLSNGGYTTLDGRLNLRNGTLRVEKVRIR